MVIRADHAAGLILVALGVAVFALSGDLPFGTLSFPGAGFLPKLVAALIIIIGAILVLGGWKSAPLASLPWRDLKHAALVLAIAIAATLLYERLGFTITLALMILALLVLVERKRLLPAVLYSAGVVAVGYFLFTALRAPIPLGPFGF